MFQAIRGSVLEANPPPPPKICYDSPSWFFVRRTEEQLAELDSDKEASSEQEQFLAFTTQVRHLLHQLSQWVKIVSTLSSLTSELDASKLSFLIWIKD